MPVSAPDIRTAARDTTPELVRLVVIHAALVAVPVLVVGLVLIPAAVAVLVAVLAGAAVTALRLRGLGDRIVTAVGAVPVPEGDRPRLRSVVESAAMAVGVSEPRLYVIDSPACNAVTWGDGTGPISTAFTTGLLDAVDRLELEAVVGRQLTVAKDPSIDVVTVATVLFGPLARGPFADVVAALVHRTVDDRCVVVADLEGARATRYPPGLVAALERVAAGTSVVAGVPAPLGVLCFAAVHGHDGPFEVHPPIEDRIDLLREI